MKYSLPQQFVPLSVSPSSTCSSSFVFSEPMYHELLPPDDCQHYLCQTSDGSASESETLTPSTMSNRNDTLANLENSENISPSVFDAGEYIHLIEPWLNWSTTQKGCIMLTTGSKPPWRTQISVFFMSDHLDLVRPSKLKNNFATILIISESWIKQICHILADSNLSNVRIYSLLLFYINFNYLWIFDC